MKKKASKNAKQLWALSIIIAFVVGMLAIAVYVTVDVMNKQ